MDKVKMVKPEATATLTFGTAFYQRVQKAIMATVTELGQENIDKFIAEMSTMSADHEFSEYWMELLYVSVTLSQEIEKDFQKTSSIFDEDITKL